MESNNHLYPIFVNLVDKPCLIVGGGEVAERKLETLLQYGAKICLVSPIVTDQINEYILTGKIRWRKGNFQTNDLEDVFMVFIATNNYSLNQEIAQACLERKILVNAVDDPPNCDFFLPAIVRRNSLAIAISTEGKSPMLAKYLRKELQEYFPEVYGEYVDLLGESREYIKANIPDINIRRQIFQDLVEADILDLLEAGEKDKARERVWQCISLWQD